MSQRMPASQPNSLFVDVTNAVSIALEARDKMQIRFASKRALNAFDSTNDLYFLALYIHCQCYLDQKKGFKMFEDFIESKYLTPEPRDLGSTYFFGLYVTHLLRSKDFFNVSESSLLYATKITKIFTDNWDKVQWSLPFLLFWFEQGDWDQVEKLANQILDRDFQHANIFLMHVSVGKNDYENAYKIFNILASSYEIEIKNSADLDAIFKAIHGDLGLYNSTNPIDAKSKAMNQTKSTHRLISSCNNLIYYISSQIFEKKPEKSKEKMNNNFPDCSLDHIPNEETEYVLSEIEQGENLIKFDSSEALFSYLGL